MKSEGSMEKLIKKFVFYSPFIIRMEILHACDIMLIKFEKKYL